jgi:hypothetical protein
VLGLRCRAGRLPWLLLPLLLHCQVLLIVLRVLLLRVVQLVRTYLRVLRNMPSYLLLLDVVVLSLLRVLLLIIRITINLLQRQCFFKLLRRADAQHLNPIHRAHLLIAVMCVKHKQQVAHSAALR